MHTDPFGWLLPKNDRLLWVRVSHLPEAHRLWSRYVLAPHNATYSDEVWAHLRTDSAFLRHQPSDCWHSVSWDSRRCRLSPGSALQTSFRQRACPIQR